MRCQSDGGCRLGGPGAHHSVQRPTPAIPQRSLQCLRKERPSPSALERRLRSWVTGVHCHQTLGQDRLWWGAPRDEDNPAHNAKQCCSNLCVWYQPHAHQVWQCWTVRKEAWGGGPGRRALGWYCGPCGAWGHSPLPAGMFWWQERSRKASQKNSGPAHTRPSLCSSDEQASVPLLDSSVLPIKTLKVF